MGRRGDTLDDKTNKKIDLLSNENTVSWKGCCCFSEFQVLFIICGRLLILLHFAPIFMQNLIAFYKEEESKTKLPRYSILFCFVTSSPNSIDVPHMRSEFGTDQKSVREKKCENIG